MLWVKLQLPSTSFWLELTAQTHVAVEQVKGLEIGARIFPKIPVQIIDTRLSKHPVEPTFDLETARQIIMDETAEMEKRNEQ